MRKAKLVRSNSVLKRAAEVLRRSLSCPKSNKPSASRVGDGDASEVYEGVENGGVTVPDDVKEGQFAVVAMWEGKPTRFVVSLSCLSNPLFLRLLELAEEEFGFENSGVLAIPCRPAELERIIREAAE